MHYTTPLTLLGLSLANAHDVPHAHLHAERATTPSCKNIAGQTFTHHALYTFTGSSLPSGLMASNNPSQHDSTAPFARQSVPEEVSVSGGFLNLKVPGGQNTSPIKCSEVTTTDGEIMYGSVRTTAIFSDVPGTCHGLFFYGSMTDECDIEYLTSPASTANAGAKGNVMPLQLTNQPLDGTRPAPAGSYIASPSTPSDATTKAHEYRMDWLPGKTVWYVDGKQVHSISENVPNQPGKWMWNNWSDGTEGWSAGPPAQDSYLKIKKIEMFYNSTGGAGNC